MGKLEDEDIETLAIGLAHTDKLEWVKRPNRKGHPDTPAGASNTERDGYRNQAREQIREEHEADKAKDSR